MLAMIEGIRVVDITTVLLGPLAAQTLGDLGADVIKVETPEGDAMRAVPPIAGEPAGGLSALLANHNRNKRSIALDLKHADGKAVLSRLVARADVVLHNMRQDAMDRLGFGFEACRALNPRLVYCAAVGYGSDGPYAGRPAYDDVIQAASGFAGLFALRDGTPALAPTVVADKVVALHVVYAVLAALLRRERASPAAPVGAQFLEVPMFESMVSFLLTEHLAGTTFDPSGSFGYHRVVTPNRRPYRTADGWIVVLPYSAAHWRKALAEIGRDGLLGDREFEDRTALSRRMPELYAVLAEALTARPTADWLAAFERLDIPCAPVNRPEALVDDPHLAAIGHFAPRYREPAPITRSLNLALRLVGEERLPDRPPPALSADAGAVLAEAGFGPDEVRRLLASPGIGRRVPRDGGG
jgi:crotonobetainyl-CoA:carnitine CoA-transferase CaiB-like acyl-CoA transferase